MIPTQALFICLHAHNLSLLEAAHYVCMYVCMYQFLS